MTTPTGRELARLAGWTNCTNTGHIHRSCLSAADSTKAVAVVLLLKEMNDD